MATQPPDLLAQAIQHHQAGRVSEAESLYRRVLARDPSHVVALNLLGLLSLQRGQSEIAAQFLGKVVMLRPSFPDAQFNLGVALSACGRLEAAANAYREAVALMPGNLKAHANLGAVLYRLGQTKSAEAACREATRIDPRAAAAWYNLGLSLDAQGKVEDAVAAWRRTVALAPDHAEAHADLGVALVKLGHWEGAVAAYRRALALDPRRADTHANLAVALTELGQPAAATAACRQAIALKPNDAAAYFNLGNALLDGGHQDAAIQAYRQALALDPNLPRVRSNLLMALQYSARTTNADILAEARDFGSRCPQVRAIQGSAARNRSPLRIGYVSGDFRTHSIGAFLTGVLPAHDREAAEFFCYSNHPVSDAITDRLRAAADGWRSLVGIPDVDAARMISRDRIDILVDLSGHTGNNRLPLFAHRPAPVQVTCLGYFGTTGLTAIDYLLADRFVLPPEDERYFTETIIRLPDSYLCFNPPALDIPVAPPPATASGIVTFACLSNRAKITVETVALFARVLQRVPGSRLLLKAASLADPLVRRDLADRFAAAGIAAGRLVLAGPSPMADYLAAYNKVDIVLDTSPFAGGTTTAQALWMGTPVISLRGQTWVGRIGESILTTIGHPDLVAADPDTYVEKAVALAGDPLRRADYSRALRTDLEASPLCDGPRFARNLEAVYRRIWQASSA